MRRIGERKVDEGGRRTWKRKGKREGMAKKWVVKEAGEKRRNN